MYILPIVSAQTGAWINSPQPSARPPSSPATMVWIKAGRLHRLCSMPFSHPPPVPPVPVVTQTTGRPTHRRSSTEETLPLHAAPLTRSSAFHLAIGEATYSRFGSHFHFQEGEERDASDNETTHTALDINSQFGTDASPSSAPDVVPSTHNHSPTNAIHPVERAISSPLVITDGRRLKSSLKSSSTLHLHDPKHTLRPRARSSPALSPLSSSMDANPPSDVEDSSSFPKAVHFPQSAEGLESVVVFRHRARPTSVRIPFDEQTETETETETDSSAVRWAGAVGGQRAGRYRAGRSSLGPGRAPDARTEDGGWRYQLEASSLPPKAKEDTMVLLEGVQLIGAHASPEALPDDGIALHGTFLVRNVVFEKQVFARFTLDDWRTTNEIQAHWVCAVERRRGDAAEEPGPGWDRFAFTIGLTHFANAPGPSTPAFTWGEEHDFVGQGLVGRTLIVAGRFVVPWADPGHAAPYVWCDQTTGAGTSSSGRPWVGTGAGGASEWWDNNGGQNYRFGFRAVSTSRTTTRRPASLVAPSSTSPHAYNSDPAFRKYPFPMTRANSYPPLKAQALVARLSQLHLQNYAAP